jgi:hypothetical protein
MVVYFFKHLIQVFVDTKPVDKCFYTGTTSGIFNLAKFAFFIRRKYHLILLLYYL